MGFWWDVLVCALSWFPAVLAGYFLFTVMRFPDISMEVTWALGGIAALLLINRNEWTPIEALVVAPTIGAACALLTYSLFRVIARQKLLAGLIGYFVLLIVGARLLDGAAVVRIVDARFGFDATGSALIFWIVVSLALLAGTYGWERSRHGIRARMIGETNDEASAIFGIRSGWYYLAILIIAGAAAALGGACFSLFNGSASNAQGIGVLIKAVFGALAGDRFCQLLKLTRRSTVLSTPVGSLLLALVLVGAEQLALKLQEGGLWIAFRDTDKQALIGVLLLLILLLRTRSDSHERKVSDL